MQKEYNNGCLYLHYATNEKHNGSTYSLAQIPKGVGGGVGGAVNRERDMEVSPSIHHAASLEMQI